MYYLNLFFKVEPKFTFEYTHLPYISFLLSSSPPLRNRVYLGGFGLFDRQILCYWQNIRDFVSINKILFNIFYLAPPINLKDIILTQLKIYNIYNLINFMNIYYQSIIKQIRVKLLNLFIYSENLRLDGYWILRAK